MTLAVRGSNPIWVNFNLEGAIFDDTYYLYVLQNDLPYLPSTQVFIDENGNVDASFPIQYLANGTLPSDIFFATGLVYRLEFRKNDGTVSPSQADELVYLVEDYVPSNGGGVTPSGTTIHTDNQLSNSQFPLISFNSPTTFTGISNTTVNVAPGWDIVVTGSGNLILTRQDLTAADAVPTNAPYGMLIETVGFTAAFLRQRFNENGTIWSSNAVASSITARTDDGNNHRITVSLVNNASSPLDLTIDEHVLTGSWQVFAGAKKVDVSTNATAPATAYTEFRVSLPSTGTIGITSLQLMGQDTPIEVPYEQETVARQVDHLFHYYKDSLLREPKASILTGWDFGLNPWQSHVKTTTNLATFGYVADQTIVVQQDYVTNANGNNISTEQAGVAQNYGFMVTSVTATNKFAIIQYIDAATARPYWGSTLSAHVKLDALKQAANAVPIKARLLYRSSAPDTLAQDEPIVTWAGDEPVYKSGWSSIAPKNDPAYSIVNGKNTLLFEGFDLTSVPSDNANMTMALVIYTTANMTSTGTPDNIVFNRVSLVENDFAIECNSLSFDETLRRCQYYYQKSFAAGTLPAANVGLVNAYTGINGVVGNVANTAGPQVRFPVEMRATPSVTTYNPGAGTSTYVYNIVNGVAWAATSTNYIGVRGFYVFGTPNSTSTAGHGSAIHWTANARLGK